MLAEINKGTLDVSELREEMKRVSELFCKQQEEVANITEKLTVLQSENDFLKSSIKSLQIALTSRLAVLPAEEKVRKEQIIEFRDPSENYNIGIVTRYLWNETERDRLPRVLLTEETINGLRFWVAKSTVEGHKYICFRESHKFISNGALYYIVVVNKPDPQRPWKTIKFYGWKISSQEIRVPRLIEEALITKIKITEEIRVFRVDNLNIVNIYDSLIDEDRINMIYFMPEDLESTLVVGEV